MSYVYKILMNSLYGRFGINPKSTTTEVCDEYRYKNLIRNSELIFGDMLSENTYIVAYHSNTEKGDDYWNPLKNSAVQLSAAITANNNFSVWKKGEEGIVTSKSHIKGSYIPSSSTPIGEMSSLCLSTTLCLVCCCKLHNATFLLN